MLQKTIAEATSDDASWGDEIQTTTLSFENLHDHGDLFANLFRARKESFISLKQWRLPEALGMEYDQYDTPASRWVVVHDEFNRVMAGNRLTPTTARCGIYSYMIRDAQRGLLDDLPTDLLYDEAPVDPHIWESSRLFVSHDVPAKIRRKVHALLISEIGKSSRNLGALTCVTMLAANWPRWAPRVNVDMVAMGPVLTIAGDDNQVVSMDFSKQLH
jgi:N-acyl-L-homoserine lactone synthetase